MIIETSIDIAAPTERVWELTLDIESHPKHTPTITSVTRLDSGQPRVGSSAAIKQPRQRTRTWTVTVLEPDRTFAWSTCTAGMLMTAVHTLEPISTGTQATLAIELTGPMSRLMGPLLRRPILHAITTENNGFKTAAEQP